eukprot:Hpha_TRINITY_DN16024_c4_g1::TRINITY_DN16024_c4_g1_i3::g.122368::m.122368
MGACGSAEKPRRRSSTAVTGLQGMTPSSKVATSVGPSDGSASDVTPSSSFGKVCHPREAVGKELEVVGVKEVDTDEYYDLAPPHKPLGREPKEYELCCMSDRGMMGLVGPEYHGKRLILTPMPGFGDSIAALRSKFHARESDIFIATYPRCGTTWTQQIVLLILAHGDKDKVKAPMLQSPWMEYGGTCKLLGMADYKDMGPGEPFYVPPMDAEEFDTWEPPAAWRAPGTPARRVLKTHSPAYLAPWVGGVEATPQGTKVIVVSRGPRDQAISNYHHCNDLAPFAYQGPGCDLQHFLGLWAAGRLDYGDYYTWHRTWWEAGLAPEQKLWLRYEDMTEDLQGTVRRIADFIGVALSEEAVQSVVAGSTFSHMKRQAEESDAKCKEAGGEPKKNHIRQGKAGGWQGTLTEEQAKWMEDYHTRRMKELGLPDAAIADS